MSGKSSLSVLPQPLPGTNGYEVLSPAGTLLGLIERGSVHAGDADGGTVAVASVHGASAVAGGSLTMACEAGRPVIRARPDEVWGLAGFVSRDRLDLWALLRARLAALPRPIAPMSREAGHLAALIDDGRALAAETDGLSAGRFALIELAWQCLRTMHDPELAEVRLADALAPGPDIPRGR